MMVTIMNIHVFSMMMVTMMTIHVCSLMMVTTHSASQSVGQVKAYLDQAGREVKAVKDAKAKRVLL